MSGHRLIRNPRKNCYGCGQDRTRGVRLRMERMDFAGRLKKEMTEGIVRALLDDAGYRVIEYGMEKTIREVTPLSHAEFLRLAMPSVVRNAPDLCVLDREQQSKWLVEIKYRSQWDRTVIEKIEPQVREYQELVLVSVFANAPNPRKILEVHPARYLRCCRLRFREGHYEMEVRTPRGKLVWEDVATLSDDENLWWKLPRMQDIFSQIGERADRNTLVNAIAAIRGILSDGAILPERILTPVADTHS